MFFTLNLKKYKNSFKVILLIIVTFFFITTALKLTKYSFPIKYENLIEKYANKYEIEKELIFAVINAESRFNPNAVSKKGAKGLMQIMPDTAIWIAEKANINNITLDNYIQIENNINLGSWYLSYFLNLYQNEALALASYNAGRTNVLKWLSNSKYSNDGKTLHTIPFDETEKYLKRINFFKKGYKIIFKLKENKFFKNFMETLYEN